MVYLPHLFMSSSISFSSILQFSEYKSIVSLLLLLLSHYVMSNSWYPMDCSPPGSSVHGISQARILEWIAISFSRGFSPGIKPQSLAFIGRLFTTESPGNFFVSFDRLIPWYFILFDAVVNGIASLISVSVVSI